MNMALNVFRWFVLIIITIFASLLIMNLFFSALQFSDTSQKKSPPSIQSLEYGIWNISGTRNVISGIQDFLSHLNILPPIQKPPTYIGVMVENHEDARPFHAGLANAIIIQEFFVEGLISRFLVIFRTNDLPEKKRRFRRFPPSSIRAGVRKRLKWLRIKKA
jgi:hypothetical protein